MQYSREVCSVFSWREFIYKYSWKNLFEVEQSQSVVIRDIFKLVPYSQTAIHNTVRNEIRKIISYWINKAKGKKYKLNSRIHASRHYHKGNRDQPGFLYELFYFPSTSKSRKKSLRICKCWFDDVVSPFCIYSDIWERL